MANKLCFLPDPNIFLIEKNITFTYVKGMSFSQKQKNVVSFHNSILETFPNAKILEVSTKSLIKLGNLLSAFNLELNGKKIECIFQSSKVFENNVQFLNLLNVSPLEAKHFIRDNANGNIVCFRYNNVVYPTNPKSLFYDYIYISALNQNKDIGDQLMNYDIFTDIEFNEKKSINCQARACAIYKSLRLSNKLDYYLSSIDTFKKIYSSFLNNDQLTLF